MANTVEALAYKTDVPARTRDAVNDRVEAIKGKVSDVVSAVKAVTSAATKTQSLGSLRSAAKDNPLGLAIGSVAAGFLIGLCLPVSEIERERVGRLGERMTEHARSAASDVLEQGKAAVVQAVDEAISSAASPPA